MERNVLVTGATGLVGGRLLPCLLADGWTVQALTRRPERAGLPPGSNPTAWDGIAPPGDALRAADAIVHLAGEPVFGGRLTEKRKQRVYASRVDSTHEIVEALRDLPPERRPSVLVCASAVGYYGSRGDELLAESADPGEGFLAELCVAWEGEARAAEELGVRVVSPRIGIVLAREGGALAPLSKLFKLGLGGRVGSGDQWVPWIHVDDLVGLIRLALEDERARGPLNAVAPHPVRNRELTDSLAKQVHRPALLPAPAFAVRAALGELADELLGSRRVTPVRALELGYAFRHERLASALAEELG